MTQDAGPHPARPWPPPGTRPLDIDVVSVQSQVVYGRVGNNVALPVLSRHGLTAAVVPTVLLSNTPHYSSLHGGAVPADWFAGWLEDLVARGALEHLRAGGWEDAAIATAALSTTFDLWRAVTAAYASAYLRAPVGAMPCGFSYRAAEVPGVCPEQLRAAWWADGTGIPPHLGITLCGGLDGSADPTLKSLLQLRELWDGDTTAAATLRNAVAATSSHMPREDLPIWIVHGAEDGLIPAAFTSDPYVIWLRAAARNPRYWRIPHAQHFDAFLQLPGFGAQHLPLLPYGFAALDAMYAHVVQGSALPDLPTPQPRPSGATPITTATLGL